MQSKTKLTHSTKIQNPGKMNQKQLDAIEHLKLFVPELPKDLVIDGNLNLSHKIVKVLPDNLTVNGNLDLTDCNHLDELPLNLTVNGNLTMDSSINGMGLRPCTKIKGNFDKFWYDNLPENFTIGGDLIVYDNVTYLPEGLTVMGNLDLTSTKVKVLPNRLKVLGNLNIEELDIAELPKDLVVGGFLDARGTKLRSFPETVVVNGGFNISHTKIKLFPRQFSHVIGDILITDTAIRVLPDNLTVVGGLYLDNAPIAELPENLHVYGALSCGGTYIESLPASLKIEYSLYLEGCPIERLPDNLMIKGSLNICDSNIVEFPAGLIVNDDLEFSNTPIKELPQFMNVGALHISKNRIAHLPENFSVTGNMLVWNGESDDVENYLGSLPKGLKVGGGLRLSENLYSSLPEGLFVGGDLDLLEHESIKRLPVKFNVGGKLTIGRREWGIVIPFLNGTSKIDGTVEMLITEYEFKLIAPDPLTDDIRSRLTWINGHTVTLSPSVKKSPANQDGGAFTEAVELNELIEA